MQALAARPDSVVIDAATLDGAYAALVEHLNEIASFPSTDPSC
jgi:hypothetical protein